VEIRLARPDDAEVWVRTHVEALAAAYADLMPLEFAEQRRRDVPTMIDERRALFAAQQADPAPGQRAWLAQDEHGGLAIAEACPGPTPWEVERRFPPPSTERQLNKLYALPRAHGTGIGQALLALAVGDAPAYLWIMAGNPRAEAFYRRNRFVPDGVESRAGPTWFGKPMFRMHRR